MTIAEDIDAVAGGILLARKFDCRVMAPARLPEAALEAAEDAARRAFAVVGGEGMARIDMIVDQNNIPWILEINTIPGFTEISLFPDAARAAGISFADLCQGLVDAALCRHRGRIGPPLPVSG